MSDQWPDPNGPWMRRMMVAQLPIGLIWFAVLVFYCAYILVSSEAHGPFFWFLYLPGQALVAVNMIVQGIYWRRRVGRR